jgi:predicted AAA+ superfamily ATPase
MLIRKDLESAVRKALARSRAVLLSGPRQCGKSTLAQRFLPRDSTHYFDLENPLHEQRLASPFETLSQLKGLVVLDEVQRMPGIFPILRVLIDRSNTPGQYLLLGSASPALLRQAGESLFGRVETIEVSGFNLQEVMQGQAYDENEQHTLWLRGGFPRAYLARNDEDSFAWRTNAINDHVRLDLPQFGINVPAPTMLRFWHMLAHYHGQVWTASHIAQSMGISEPTVRRYLDTLTQTLMIRQLQPWYENLSKRQVKSPKIYFRDTGLLHALMGVQSLPQLLTHPQSGASWEGFALEQVIRISQPDAAYFWATHARAELDLLLMKGQQRIGVEFKRADVPKVTPSMRIAMHDLKLDKLYVVYPGQHRFAIADRIEAVPLWAVLRSDAPAG